MKIAFIDTTICGELIGGAQTFLFKLADGLALSGHEVHVVSNGSGNNKIRRQIQDSQAAVHADLWESSGLVEETASVLAHRLNDLRPDVFVVSVSPDIGWVVLPQLDPQIATVAIGHTDSETFYAPARHYREFLTRVVGVSAEVCESYDSKCGIDKTRIEWIPYGVEASETAPMETDGGPLRMIYVGRIDEHQKRISDLIKVVRRLSHEGVDFTFEIVGDGDEMPTVKRELAGEIASGCVVLHGWLDGDEVIARLRVSEVFVLTSAYEGFCIALVEAMANGCTPVVTDIKSGNKQLVQDGENGFVVSVGDIDGFVDKIKVLADDRKKLLRMRRRAWATGKQYSIERMVDNYGRCFEKAVEDNRANMRTPDPSFPLMPSCRSKYPLWLRRIKARFLATN